MTYAPKVEPRPPESWSAGPRAVSGETELAIEAGRLLQDLRVAVGHDRDAADRAIAHLEALLAGSPPEMPRASHARGGLAPWQKRKIEDYIERHLDASIRVEDLAKLVSLSSGYFCRSFKESFSDTPHAYIMRIRIKRAQKLMLASPDPLSQIALACGHADQAHFSRRFRQEMGETPNAWRRRHAMGSWATAAG